MGARKNPIWRVVVADQRSPRDGRVIETIGHYNPQTTPSTVVIDNERAAAWIAKGAQPSNAVRRLLAIGRHAAAHGTAGEDAAPAADGTQDAAATADGEQPEAVAGEAGEAA